MACWLITYHRYHCSATMRMFYMWIARCEWPFTVLLIAEWTQMIMDSLATTRGQLLFPESDEEWASVWPGRDTSADSTNVCIQHQSNTIPISHTPIPKQSPLACSTLCHWISAFPLKVQPQTTWICLFIPACFRLALCCCRKTTRSALSAITE